MIHEHEVREQLAALIRRDMSLAGFERWLASESWNMFSDSSAEAIQLVADLNMLISEHYEDRLDDREFRAELLKILNNVNESVVIRLDAGISFAPLVRNTFSGSMSPWVAEDWALAPAI